MSTKARFLVLLFTTLASLADIAHAGPPSLAGYNSSAGLKPSKDFKGRYPALVKSMMSGQVRSINVNNVSRYGTAYLGAFNNTLYWIVPVEYVEKFVPPARDSRGYGMVMGEALACVRHGRVEYWIHKKSRTVVR